MEKINIKFSSLVSPLDKKKFEEETLNLLNADKELKDYLYSHYSKEIIEASLSSIRRCLDSNNACKECKAFYMCKSKFGKGIKRVLIYNENINKLEDCLTNCKYYAEILRIFDKLVYSSIPKDDIYNTYVKSYLYISKMLEKKNPLNNSFADVAKKSLIQMKNYSLNTNNRGLYISCSNSNGDNLLKFLAFSYLKRGIKASVIDAKTLLTDASSYNKEISKEAKKDIQVAFDADFLAIIGLGFETKTKSSLESIIIPNLVSRNKKGKITYISSFFEIDDLIKAYVNYNSNPIGKLFNKAIEDISNVVNLDDYEIF